MAGAHPRRKGRRGENELATILGATRISESGSFGPDLQWRGHFVEVKRRATRDGFSLPDRLLAECTIVALRADRGQWVICMRPETLLDLINP